MFPISRFIISLGAGSVTSCVKVSLPDQGLAEVVNLVKNGGLIGLIYPPSA